MFIATRLLLLFVTLVTALSPLAAHATKSSDRERPAPARLDNILAPFLARYELAALAAAVVKDGKIIAAGAVGTRKAGANLPVTLNDRFHLGSNTKAMTALLAGMILRSEQGVLRPFLCKGNDGNRYFVKGRGAGYWTLISEVVGGSIAKAHDDPARCLPCGLFT